MSLNGKIHNKLSCSKNATVSLDSLLGILSSAYGTEALDSKIVLEQDNINLRNLTIENLKAYSEALKNVEKEIHINTEDVPIEIEKLNASTSTSYLKSTRSLEDELDITLLSIKSSENLKPPVYKPNDDNNELPGQGDNTVLQESEEKPPEFECAELEQWQTICGFFIDDASKRVVFDIKFSKKLNKSQEMFPAFDIVEPDITIDVIDSCKQSKTKIEIPKRHLVSKGEYFADVDKRFGLETLNTVVNCNLCVFQWLIQWLSADIPMCKPTLNVNNLNLVLSIAHNLGVHELVEECLDYFPQNIENVFRTNSDIEYAFDDYLFSKLVLRFCNTEVENISDDFVFFKERMFCSLITLLADKKPSSTLGHYATLATLFQCRFCKKLLTTKLLKSIPCRSDCNQFSVKGELIPLHESSPSWDLSKYIELLYKDMKSWRMVYWRLWGLCHFMSCEVCNTIYPLTQADWCVDHPEEVGYFPMNQNMCYPIGTYKCCGEISFMFSALQQNGGCSYRSHKPQINSKYNRNTFKVYEKHKPLISNGPTEIPKVKTFYRLLKNSSDGEPSQGVAPENFWWHGFQLAPKEKKDYSLIPMCVLDKLRNRSPEKIEPPICKPLTYETEIHFGSTPTFTDSVVPPNTNSVKNKPKTMAKKGSISNALNPSKSGLKKRKPTLGCLYQPEETLWQSTEMNKTNQDTQRDFEEIAMRSLVKMLSEEDKGVSRTEPSAGTYVRLEADFCQDYCSRNKPSAGTVARQSSVINRTFPLSWFRRLTI